MYFSCQHLVNNILLPHLSKAPLQREGTQLELGITAAGCSQKASLYPTSETTLQPPPGILHTITSPKNPKTHYLQMCVKRSARIVLYPSKTLFALKI